MARRMLIADASGRRVRGRPKLGCMYGHEDGFEQQRDDDGA